MALLRKVYGIEDPHRLYVSDSTEDGLLKYDTRVKTCATCYVNSYRVGFVSIRRQGESWEALERRIKAMHAGDFSAGAHNISTSVADMDPGIRSDVERMLSDARRAGFPLRVTASYRSPEREAFLMATRPRSTHTLTSLHSYGRALDVNLESIRSRAAKRMQLIAFRKWVISYKGDEFQIIGKPDRTWDWSHVELPSSTIGFRDIESALARARQCTRPGGSIPCEFQPRLPNSPSRH